jgi:hypothetical protein
VVPPWRFLGDLQLSCGDLPKLCGASVVIPWEPPIELWRFPQALYRFGDRPQVSHSDRVFHLGGRAQRDYGEPPWRLGEPCASTPLQRRLASARV